MKMDASREELLSVKEYAALFRRHPTTVYDAIHANKLPYPVERPTGGGFEIRVPREVIMKLRTAKISL